MPRSRSFIWDYFTKREPGVAQCDNCHRKIHVIGGSTSNLIQHLKRNHKDLLQDESTVNENGPKEEYIVLQGENYTEYIEEVHSKGDESHYEIIPTPPKAKKSKNSPQDTEFSMKFSSDPIRVQPIKSTIRQEKEAENPLEIFSRYMISLMEDMSQEKCEEAQLRIVSVILEVKRDKGPQDKTEDKRQPELATYEYNIQ